MIPLQRVDYKYAVYGDTSHTDDTHGNYTIALDTNKARVTLTPKPSLFNRKTIHVPMSNIASYIEKEIIVAPVKPSAKPKLVSTKAKK